MKKLLIVLLVTTFISCSSGSDEETDPALKTEYADIPAPQNLSYRVVAQHPKDTGAFTQGIEIYNGKLYESTGDYENSSIRISNWRTGQVEQKHMMGSDKIFGEGLTILNNKIYQLTWQSNVVYVYDIKNINKPEKTIKWPKEGWGLTNNGTELIISDGSNQLYFVDPTSFEVKRTIKVVSYKGPITELNELEFINGFIYANVYQQNYIVKVDPSNGHVVAVMVLENLLQQADAIPGRTDVLNGIAYDSTTQTMLVTGKRWPKLFEIKLD